MSTATRGRAYEHKVRDDLTTHGWVQVARSAGSKGAADLVMVHPMHGIALLQVGTGNKTLGPDDRARLVTLADLCTALALLAVVVPRQPVRYFQVTRDVPSTWPEWNPRLTDTVMCDGCGRDLPWIDWCDHGRVTCTEYTQFAPCRHCKREARP